MSQLGTEFKVGLFTLLGGAALVFAVFVLNPDIFERDEKKSYITILKDASGILPKTHVKTNGVIVGKVKSVDLLENATQITFEISKEVVLPKGSQIEVQTVGFLGDKYIDIIRPDEVSIGVIEPGELVPRTKDSLSLNEILKLAGEVASDIKTVTKSFSEVLGNNEGRKSLQSIVSGLDSLVNNASGLVSENRENLHNTIAELKVFARSLNQVLNSENRGRIDRILASFDESMTEVKGAAKNINLISQKVENGEGTIGRLVNDEKTLDDLEGAIQDIRKVLSPASKLEVEVDYHGEYRRFGSSQHYFNLNLKPRPDSYYILGFTDRTYDTKETTTTVTGNKENKSTKEKRALRFNLQFVKRWYFAAIRFGLFETTGGVASDFFMLDDRLKISLEAFEFAEENSTERKFAHLKAYASVLFFDHLQVMIGLDDPTKFKTDTKDIDPRLNYFLGAGVKFTDQDLKALFGLASLASP